MEKTLGKLNSEGFHFSGRGEIYSFTVVYDAPEKFQFLAPYIIALVRLEEGPTVTAMLTDMTPEEAYIGMPVEMVTRILSQDGDRGLISYGYKFRSPILRAT